MPGGQAELLRVPQAQYGPIKVPQGPPDDRFVYLSDVLPTAWQAVQYAAIPSGGSVAVLGLGPIGDMSTRIALPAGGGTGLRRSTSCRNDWSGRAATVSTTFDLGAIDDVADAVRDATDGRGPDAVIDAVGMEAHGAPFGKLAQQITGLLPDAVATKMMKKAGVDRLSALHLAIDLVRRGGTISVIGVYGGMTDPLPMLTLFDKQIQVRMGQANVKRWVDDILPLLTDDDPSASTASPRTACRWARRRRRTRSSRRSRTTRSRCCSSPERRPARRGHGSLLGRSLELGRQTACLVLEAVGRRAHRQPALPHRVAEHAHHRLGRHRVRRGVARLERVRRTAAGR